MYPVWVLGLLFSAVFVWLLTLSFLVWREDRFLKSLFPKSGERDIRKKLEEVLENLKALNQDKDIIVNNLAKLTKQTEVHIQRVQLMRYNPYDDTGGDQSFSIAFLDSLGNGIVITSLHSRSGTRVFAKPIEKGMAKQYQLSREEEVVIKKATGIK